MILLVQISFGVTFSWLVNFSSGFSLIAFTAFPFFGYSWSVYEMEVNFGFRAPMASKSPGGVILQTFWVIFVVDELVFRPALNSDTRG